MGEIPEMATEAFIAGLLHNLGVVIQSQLTRRNGQMIPPAAQAIPADIRTLEEENMPHQHGGRLDSFEEWNCRRHS